MRQISGSELGVSFIVLSVGLVLLIAAVLVVVPQLWSLVVGSGERYRIRTLDGARGLLTTWVLSHHLMLASFIDAHGVWQPPAGALGVLLLSGFFVAPFFMLTAMLFGDRLLTRPGQFDARSFAIRRAFRLVPVYVLAVALLALGAFIQTGFVLRQSLPSIVGEIARWMAFDFVERSQINGVDLQRHYGVLWTLRYEILFYAGLPVLAWLQRMTGNRYVIIPALLLVGFFSWPFKYFAAGAVAAWCLRWSGPRARIGWQVAAVAGLVAIYLVASLGRPSHIIFALCLIPTLICLSLEVPLARWLRWRPLRLMGEASYSSYVLHAAVMFLASLFVAAPYSVLNYDFVPRMGWLLLYATFTMMVSILAFVTIERPIVQLGALLARRRRTVRESGGRPAPQTP